MIKPVRSHRDSNSGHLLAKLGPIVERPPAELRLSDTNPRRHPKKQLDRLQSAIARFGFVVPVLVSIEGEVIAGEARVLAARELGLPTIPTTCAEHLTPAEIRAYRIFDNRIVEESEWDQERLACEFAAIIETGEVQIEWTGFETGTVDVIIETAGQQSSGGSADPADTVPEPEPAITRSGDLWELGKHRLLCAASQDRSAWDRLGDGTATKAAMLFTDPPYNVQVNGHVSGTKRHREFVEASGEMSSAEFTAFLTKTVGAAAERLEDGAVGYICMDHRHLPELYAAVAACNLQPLNLCVWNKTNGGMGSLYRSKHELVLVVKKGKAPHTNNVQLGKFGRYRTNVWDYAGANSFGKTRKADLADHPTVKPIALVADAIRDVTHPGELVLDGFMGSGTTLLAAERTGRVAYGMDVDGRYVDVTIRRWERMTGRQARLAGTSETLVELAARRAAEGAASVDTSSEPPSVPVIRQRSRAA